jgi:hypothetical protein
LSCICIFAQTRFYGVVTTSGGEPVPYVNVLLVNAADSVYVAGTTADVDGHFDFTTDKDCSGCMLKVSQVGYIDKYITNLCGESYSIMLEEPVNELNEVVVTTNKPITRIEDGALATTIRGTVLEHLGTANDVLSQLPGLINKQGTIEVLGKGAPVVYINGRMMRNSNELDMLASERIVKVEVVTNPGARYDATVKSVIRITTDRAPGEGISFADRTVLGYCDYVYAKEQVDVNYRHNNLDVFTRLSYNKNKSKSRIESEQNTLAKNLYTQDFDLSQHGKSQYLDGQLGFDYTPANNQSLGAYYQITHRPSNYTMWQTSNSYINKAFEENSDFIKNGSGRTTQQLVDGYYSGYFNKWSIDATFDLMWIKAHSNSTIDEKTPSADNTYTFKDKSTSHLYAGKLNASRPIWRGNITFGSEYTNSRRDQTFLNPEGLVSNTNPLIDEDNIGVFAETMQSFGRVTVSAGVRYEHVISDYFEFGKKIDTQSRNYDKLFPLGWIYLPAGKYSFMLSYAKRYMRPLYEQLSNTVGYSNRYTYYTGNPLLKPQYTDNIELNIRRDWVMFDVNYKIISDKFISTYSPYNGNDEITLEMKDNSREKMRQVEALVIINPQFGKYYLNFMGGVIAQRFKSEYHGKMKSFNNPQGIIRASNLFSISQDFMINADFQWMSDGNGENNKVSHNWNLDLGVTKMFGSHWSVKLSATDIFNTSLHNRRFITYSGNSDIDVMQHLNMRGIECTVRYNFNATKSKYTGRGAGAEEKSRM